MAAATVGSPWARRVLIGSALLLAVLIFILPLATIFTYAFSEGWAMYRANVTSPDTLHAVWLTLVVAVIAVPVNTLFGFAAAWAVTRFDFRGRKPLMTLVELPFAVSPIVAGTIFLFVFGAQGLFGPWLLEHGIKVMFALPGIVLVTVFVTAPYVARELIPLMQVQQSDEEESALTLGASAWRMLWHVTLPKVRWALLYGATLCTARAMGEFGSVSVVSGNIRGETNTLPLQIELLFNDYSATGAFAAATLLTVLALVTLVIKLLLEHRRRVD